MLAVVNETQAARRRLLMTLNECIVNFTLCFWSSESFELVEMSYQPVVLLV